MSFDVAEQSKEGSKKGSWVLAFSSGRDFKLSTVSGPFFRCCID